MGRNDGVVWSPYHTRDSVVTAGQSQTRLGGSSLEPHIAEPFGIQGAVHTPGRAGTELVLVHCTSSVLFDVLI